MYVQGGDKGQNACPSLPRPLQHGPRVDSTHSGPNRGQSGCSECHRAQQDGGGGGLGVTFQDPAHPGTRGGESGTEAAASAMCSLIPPPAPCSFRFPIKTCPEGRPPRWSQPPGQSLLWFCGLSAPPSGLALDGVGPPPGPLSTSGPSVLRPRRALPGPSTWV